MERSKSKYIITARTKQFAEAARFLIYKIDDVKFSRNEKTKRFLKATEFDQMENVAYHRSMALAFELVPKNYRELVGCLQNK